MAIITNKNIDNSGLVLPDLQGYGGKSQYELALETAQNQLKAAEELNLLDRDLTDILGGNGRGGNNSGGNGYSGGSSGKGGVQEEKQDLQKDIDEYYEHLQELEREAEEKAEQVSKDKWLLYAAIGIGIYSIIK